jgi:hypothetical protein
MLSLLPPRARSARQPQGQRPAPPRCRRRRQRRRQRRHRGADRCRRRPHQTLPPPRRPAATRRRDPAADTPPTYGVIANRQPFLPKGRNPRSWFAGKILRPPWLSNCLPQMRRGVRCHASALVGAHQSCTRSGARVRTTRRRNRWQSGVLPEGMTNSVMKASTGRRSSKMPATTKRCRRPTDSLFGRLAGLLIDGICHDPPPRSECPRNGLSGRSASQPRPAKFSLRGLGGFGAACVEHQVFPVDCGATHPLNQGMRK